MSEPFTDTAPNRGRPSRHSDEGRREPERKRPGSGEGPALAAGLCAAVSAGVLYAARSDFGLVAGPWQGVLALTDTFYHRPLLWTWMAHGVSLVAPSHEVFALGFITIILGAMCCGLVAMLAASAAVRSLSRIEAAVCGCAAGIFFSLTNVWGRASLECSPAVLTVFLALSAFWVMRRTGGTRQFLGGGALIGLAAANHPSFAVLALLLAVVAVASTHDETKVFRAILLFGLGFVATACVPFVTALVRGEGLAGFLSHALQTPYPTVGDGAPEMGYIHDLMEQLSTPLLLAAVPALIFLVRPPMRRPALVGAFTFLSMGPFLPALTNHSTDSSLLNDPSASRAMVMAVVCLYAGWGLSFVVAWIIRGNRFRRLRTGAIAVGTCLLVLSQCSYLPTPSGDTPLHLAQAILADCPKGSILVTGNAGLHSMLQTVRTVYGERADVTLLPADALPSVPLRARARSSGLGNVVLDPLFPPADAIDRWGSERPLEIAEIADAQRKSPSVDVDLMNLALWELVRDNFARRPISFVGVSAPWLTARAQRNGVVLVYPRQDARSDASLSVLETCGAQGRRGTADSAFTESIVAVLLPLSDTARRQGDMAQAAAAAALARQFAGTDTRPWLSSARAAARDGNREQAMSFVEQYLRRQPPGAKTIGLAKLIQEDLLRKALADEFAALFKDKAPLPPDPKTREGLAKRLWSLDELSVLAAAYEGASKRGLGPDDVDEICDWAAVLTQLGELRQARSELSKAISFNIWRVRDRLREDPRFNLLHVETAQKRTMAS